MGLNQHPGPGEYLPARSAGSTSRAAGSESVRVDIGELVLDGFAPGVDGSRVQESFQSELARLVREKGLPLGGRVHGGAVLDALAGLPALPAGLTSRRLGQELARAVHEGLTGSSARTASPPSVRESAGESARRGGAR